MQQKKNPAVKVALLSLMKKTHLHVKKLSSISEFGGKLFMA
jgi:hypothetical protein